MTLRKWIWIQVKSRVDEHAEELIAALAVGLVVAAVML
jgi:hypothetical protein